MDRCKNYEIGAKRNQTYSVRFSDLEDVPLQFVRADSFGKAAEAASRMIELDRTSLTRTHVVLLSEPTRTGTVMIKCEKRTFYKSV